MACCSCGVMTRDWRWRSSNLCVAAMSLNLLEAKPFAQVNAADVLVGDDFVWGAFHQHYPVVDDVGAVDDLQGLAHVVVGDQHADTAVLQVGHQVADVADCDRIDASQGLVEKEEAGVGPEPPGGPAAPRLAPGQP